MMLKVGSYNFVEIETKTCAEQGDDDSKQEISGDVAQENDEQDENKVKCETFLGHR